MIEYMMMAFFIGCLWSRVYYAIFGCKNGDWLKSTNWFKGKWWKKVHSVFCWSCPKKHTGCKTYLDKKD